MVAASVAASVSVSVDVSPRLLPPVLLPCCVCCFVVLLMNRAELCSYTFDICEGVKLVRRPRVTYLFFVLYFSFPPIFCVYFCCFVFRVWCVCLPLCAFPLLLFVCLFTNCFLCVPASDSSFEPVFSSSVCSSGGGVLPGGRGAKQTAARLMPLFIVFFCCCADSLTGEN